LNLSVVAEKRSGSTGAGRALLGTAGRRRATAMADLEKSNLGERAEFNLNLDFVVLKSNEGESVACVAAEPELKRDVEKVRVLATREASETVNVANHLVETVNLASGDCEFLPDVEPFTIVLVDSLTTDLDFDRADESMADFGSPSE
jgi:hypothetical protein